MQVRGPAPLPAPLLAPAGRQSSEAKARDAKERDRAASDFETLLVTRLLKTARAARLGDDLMGGNDQVRDMIDEHQGRIIAGAAPLGLAQLLAKGARP